MQRREEGLSDESVFRILTIDTARMQKPTGLFYWVILTLLLRREKSAEVVLAAPLVVAK